MVVSRHVTETEHGVAEASILSELAGSNQGAPRKRQGSETYPGVAAARHKLPRVAPAPQDLRKKLWFTVALEQSQYPEPSRSAAAMASQLSAMTSVPQFHGLRTYSSPRSMAALPSLRKRSQGIRCDYIGSSTNLVRSHTYSCERVFDRVVD
jgi:hypothetical protein